MDFNVYLPDALGERVKREQGLNMSRIFRDAITHELDRRQAMSNTLGHMSTIELRLETKDGAAYIGRFDGVPIAEDRNVSVYLADDERVILYDEKKGKHWVLDNPVDELREELGDEAYLDAMGALGETAVVDL